MCCWSRATSRRGAAFGVTFALLFSRLASHQRHDFVGRELVRRTHAAQTRNHAVTARQFAAAKARLAEPRFAIDDIEGDLRVGE
jgi:hypothetical protein